MSCTFYSKILAAGLPASYCKGQFTPHRQAPTDAHRLAMTMRIFHFKHASPMTPFVLFAVFSGYVYCCGSTEAVIRLVLSALVGVATVIILVYDIRSRPAEQDQAHIPSSDSVYCCDSAEAVIRLVLSALVGVAAVAAVVILVYDIRSRRAKQDS
ncbi:hypothetical protein QQF64_019784 [Cirrhinus molitorella]|uniref:Uncharacterized protein n=1 Tax=Cirrhinus molitorella TaxID=172907 RepID=A0ABR3LKI5_9TELE